jgi:hypothetical protein
MWQCRYTDHWRHRRQYLLRHCLDCTNCHWNWNWIYTVSVFTETLMALTLTFTEAVITLTPLKRIETLTFPYWFALIFNFRHWNHDPSERRCQCNSSSSDHQCSANSVSVRVAIRTSFGATVPDFDRLYPTKICTRRVRIIVSHLNFFHFKPLMNHLLAELRKTACRSLNYFLEMWTDLSDLQVSECCIYFNLSFFYRLLNIALRIKLVFWLSSRMKP